MGVGLVEAEMMDSGMLILGRPFSWSRSGKSWANLTGSPLLRTDAAEAQACTLAQMVAESIVEGDVI